MKEQDELIKTLTLENYIWVIYIGIAFFNIYADELIKKAIKNNTKDEENKARKIFLGVLIITIIIYIYFLNKNYKDWKKHYDKEEYKIRLLGSILVLTGTLCFLYFQLKTKNEVDSVSNI